MIINKDSFGFGAAMGFIAPVIGVVLFKVYKFGVFTYKEVFQFMLLEPGHKTLSVALTLSLLLNALLFTLYVNSSKDKTAKGIFLTTVIYGIVVLLLKTFG